MEALHLMGTYENKAVFKSGTESTPYHYRGQYEDFGECKASLFRTNSKEEIFLQICKTIAFENLLDNHPYIKFLKKTKVYGSYIYINNTAIAQHYEMQTPYLDLTSNFDVASFFATCIYNNDIKKFIPYNGKEKLGVIYVYNEMLEFLASNNKMPNFEYIGWQGLSRPEEQRASIYKLNNDSDFNMNKSVRKYLFKHSPSSSKRIWNKFNKGDILFPNDTATILANECKNLSSFTNDEIESAKQRFKQWTTTNIDDNSSYIDNLTVNDNSSLNWGELSEYKESYWIDKFNEVLPKTRSRLCANHLQLK